MPWNKIHSPTEESARGDSGTLAGACPLQGMGMGMCMYVSNLNSSGLDISGGCESCDVDADELKRAQVVECTARAACDAGRTIYQRQTIES